MTPAPVERSRVLELGCGRGGNVIPMALALPEAHFCGIDLSSRQVDEARELARSVGVTNLELRSMSFEDIEDSFGPFDYVICHGVYSWVPREIQESLLTTKELERCECDRRAGYIDRFS